MTGQRVVLVNFLSLHIIHVVVKCAFTKHRSTLPLHGGVNIDHTDTG